MRDASRQQNVRNVVASGVSIAALLLAAAAWYAVQTQRMPALPEPARPPLSAAPRPGAQPEIQAIDVSAARTEVDRDVIVSATIRPSQAASSAYVYRWSAQAGAFSGDGPVVTWRVAKGTTTLPGDIFLRLDLVEQYHDFEAAWPPAIREREVAAEAGPFRVEDSRADLTRLAHAFLVEYFGNSTVSPEATLVDFSDSCPGKAEELVDVTQNRKEVVVESAEIRIERIDFDSAMTRADITAPCTFRDREIATGKKGLTVGNCLLTATYEQRRWWLCDSHLRGTHTVLGP